MLLFNGIFVSGVTVPEFNLANTQFFLPMNPYMNKADTRGYPAFHSNTTHSHEKSTTLFTSNITTSTTEYYERMAK